LITMTNPAIETVRARNVIGLEIRTSNAAEANPQTARIPSVWGTFFQREQEIPNRVHPDIIIGAYANYASDHRGDYSLIVGSEVAAVDRIADGMTAIAIPAGRFLVFTAEGEMPLALIEKWADIWRYFPEHPELQRAYTTDFELHDKNTGHKVDVYIAIR
jgi:predicted transcriptional regulator YdeE